MASILTVFIRSTQNLYPSAQVVESDFIHSIQLMLKMKIDAVRHHLASFLQEEIL